MKVQRDFLLLVTLAAAVATPASGQMGPPEAAEMFIGNWWHPTLPSFEPLATGPKPVTNRTRYRGVSDYNNLVGDYTNPILNLWAAEVVRSTERSRSGQYRSQPSQPMLAQSAAVHLQEFRAADAAEAERDHAYLRTGS